MGTALHAFIEIDYSTGIPPFSNAAAVRSFNSGEFFVWKDYALYDALAGGRHRSVDPGAGQGPELIAPRGLPEGISDAVRNRAFVFVDWTNQGRTHISFPSLQVPPVLLTEPEFEILGWVPPKAINSQSVPSPSNAMSQDLLLNPNWHSISWLNLDEITRCFEHARYDLSKASCEVRVILAVMQKFEDELGKGHCRLVFWFDN